MGATIASLTVEEFLRLPEKAGVKRELLGGVVVEMGCANSGHEIVKARLIRRLVVHVESHPGYQVFSESMVILGPDGALIPDVMLLRDERVRATNPDQRFQGAPDLAVKVVSSESASDLQDKIRAYLRHGSTAVWIVYPKQRIIHTYAPGGRSQMLDESKALEDVELLPGFQLPIAHLFAEL